MASAADGLSFDEVLVAAQRGEGWAFDWLYRRYHGRLVAYFRRQGCGDDSEDLAMEVWSGLVGSGNGLVAFRGGEEDFAAWLLTVAGRRMTDHRRLWGRRRRRVEMVRLEASDLSTSLAEPGRDPAEILARRVSLHHLLEILESVLTARQFRVFVLHVIHRYKLVEVARIIGSTPNAVTIQYHRALRRLASHLRRTHNDDIPREDDLGRE